MTGVGGRVDGHQGGATGADAPDERVALFGGPRRLTDGEERHHPGRRQLVGPEVADVGHPAAVEAGGLGQLGEGDGGLVEHPVDPGGPVAVRGHLGHVEERGPRHVRILPSGASGARMPR